MNIETFIEEHGEVLNGMIVVSWITRQTFEQLQEIRIDGGDDPASITEEDFLEYVRSNVADYIGQEYNEGGQLALERITLITGEYGMEVD
jgi:hypothetical protein